MLRAEQHSDELKIVWNLDDGVARDPAEFAALTLFPQGFLPKKCSCYLMGGKKAPLLEWRALIASLQPLLDQRVKLHFICASQEIARWLQEMGAVLLGEVACDINAREKK